MVFLAECNFCCQNIYGVKNIWIPWCLVCNEPFEDSTFCLECLDIITKYKHKGLNVIDVLCDIDETHQIGYDNPREVPK